MRRADERRRVVHVGVGRGDVEVAGDDHRIAGRGDGVEVGAQAVEPGQLVLVVVGVERSAVRHVHGDDGDAVAARRHDAGLGVGLGAVGEAERDVVEPDAATGSPRRSSGPHRGGRPRSPSPRTSAAGRRRRRASSPACRRRRAATSASHCSTRSWRTLSELTFQVAKRISVGCRALRRPLARAGCPLRRRASWPPPSSLAPSVRRRAVFAAAFFAGAAWRRRRLLRRAAFAAPPWPARLRGAAFFAGGRRLPAASAARPAGSAHGFFAPAPLRVARRPAPRRAAFLAAPLRARCRRRRRPPRRAPRARASARPRRTGATVRHGEVDAAPGRGEAGDDERDGVADLHHLAGAARRRVAHQAQRHVAAHVADR